MNVWTYQRECVTFNGGLTCQQCRQRTPHHFVLRAARPSRCVHICAECAGTHTHLTTLQLDRQNLTRPACA